MLSCLRLALRWSRSGEVFTWGHPWGQDHANGNLLAQGAPEAMLTDLSPDVDNEPGPGRVAGLEVRPDEFDMWHGARLPRRVLGDVGAVAELSCSTYSTLAITTDGRARPRSNGRTPVRPPACAAPRGRPRVPRPRDARRGASTRRRAYSWGDCDGDSLGHDVEDCHTPQRLASLAGLRVAHGAMCYTNGAAALTDGQVYVWGGGQWQGGIGGGSHGPQRVGFGGGVPPCYRCSSVALGSWHGYLVLRRLP